MNWKLIHPKTLNSPKARVEPVVMDATAMFVDVGQGDCTIVVDRDAREGLLIDCPSGQANLALSLLEEEGVREIRLAMITHSHADHAAGIRHVVTQIPTREIRYNHDRIVPGDEAGMIQLTTMLRALEGLEDDGVTLGPATVGASGFVGCVTWHVLAPTHGQVSGAQARRSPNYSSVIIRLDIGDHRILVAGDADGQAWRRLLTDNPESVKADAFRLPHHGDFFGVTSVGASTAEILDAVAARYHIISVGSANNHGHPELETLEELAQSVRVSRVFCTQVNRSCLAGRPFPSDVARTSLPAGSLVGASQPAGSCPCAGTVQVDITENGWTWSPSEQEHGAVIEALGQPACRR